MVWLFDVDGTLVGSVRSDRLRPGAQELLNELDGRGVTCVLWSAGGAAYARRMAQQHGIVGAISQHRRQLHRGLDPYVLTTLLSHDGSVYHPRLGATIAMRTMS